MVTDDDKRPQQGVQAVEIGLRIAKALARAGTSLPLGELAALAELPSSKAHRYLVSLCRSGMIEQDRRTGRYDLGSSAIALGLEAQNRLDEYRRLDETLQSLFDTTQLALAAMTWGGKGPTIIRRLEPVRAIIVSARIGASLNLVGPSSGTLFAAFLPSDVIDPVVNEEFAAKVKPPISRKDFNDEVRKARQRGLASTRGAYIPGFEALSAPVFNASGELIVTISMLASSGTADFSFDGEYAHDLKQAAESLSRRLGYRERR